VGTAVHRYLHVEGNQRHPPLLPVERRQSLRDCSAPGLQVGEARLRRLPACLPRFERLPLSGDQRSSLPQSGQLGREWGGVLLVCKGCDGTDEVPSLALEVGERPLGGGPCAGLGW
jgi:hypothetical protein